MTIVIRLMRFRNATINRRVTPALTLEWWI
jgi:hypothetical protein